MSRLREGLTLSSLLMTWIATIGMPLKDTVMCRVQETLQRCRSAIHRFALLFLMLGCTSSCENCSTCWNTNLCKFATRWAFKQLDCFTFMIFIPLTFSDEPAARLSRWLQGFGHAEWAGGALNPLNPSRDCMRLLHMTTAEKWNFILLALCFFWQWPCCLYVKQANIKGSQTGSQHQTFQP